MTRHLLVCAIACLSSASAALAQQVVHYEPADKDLKYVYATVPPVATLKPGDTLETRTADAFGNVDPEARRHDGDGQGRQPADRSLRDRRRRARRHARREDPRSDRRFEEGRRRARARIRRVEHDDLHADAQPEPAREDLVLRHRQRGEHGHLPRARFGLQREDSDAPVPRLHRRGAVRRRGAQLGRPGRIRRQHGRARSEPRPHALPARSTHPARCCTSATVMRRRATGKSRARRSKCRSASACRSI